MRTILIDLSGLYWAAWHAVGNDGLEAPSRRVRERIAELAEGYDRAILCLDHGSWRTEIFPAYKANRPPKPEAAVLEFDRIKADLARRYPCASAANYEADDVLATLARAGVAAGHEVTVATGDKEGHPTTTFPSANAALTIGPLVPCIMTACSLPEIATTTGSPSSSTAQHEVTLTE